MILMVVQTTHLVATNSFPEHVEQSQSFLNHVFATTRDYAARSRILFWCAGGLNFHVIHHLYPNVCHTHYGPLTIILRETSQEFSGPYRETISFWQALTQHVVLLKELGR